MSQKSPKFLITLVIILSLAVTSAAGFLVLKDREIDFGKFFSLFSTEKKNTAQEKSKTKTSASLIKTILHDNPNQTTKKQENLTKNVSERLAATALATNLDISELEKNPGIMERTMAGIEDYFKMPEISDNEIKISNDNSKEAVLSYVSAMITALSYGALPIEYFENLQKKGVENINPEELPKIEQLLRDYEKSIEELRKITTPYSWKEIHKEQISILMLTANLLQDIINQDKDSLRAELAMQKLEEVSDLIIKLEEKIYNLAQEQQIFTSSQS